MDEGYFSVGLSSELDFAPRCVKCKEKAVASKMKCVGKQKTVWICRVCHSRSTQLYKQYGSWPPQAFKELSEIEKTEFYQSIKTINNSKALKQFTDDKISIGKEEYFSAENRGEYLPLSVWKKRGFNAQKIKRLCNDVRTHAVLGKKHIAWIYTKRGTALTSFTRAPKIMS